MCQYVCRMAHKMFSDTVSRQHSTVSTTALRTATAVWQLSTRPSGHFRGKRYVNVAESIRRSFRPPRAPRWLATPPRRARSTLRRAGGRTDLGGAAAPAAGTASGSPRGPSTAAAQGSPRGPAQRGGLQRAPPPRERPPRNRRRRCRRSTLRRRCWTHRSRRRRRNRSHRRYRRRSLPLRRSHRPRPPGVGAGGWPPKAR